MKTFAITYFPIVGGIAVPISYDEKAKSLKAILSKTMKKYDSFDCQELVWVDSKIVFGELTQIRNYELYN